LERSHAPANPAISEKAQPSLILILPAAIGRLAVLFIIASVSFSTIWLMAFALPATSKPPRNKINMAFQSYTVTFGASK
jgi:hypothetical protein